MSKLAYILPLVLLLSLHACNARHLNLTDKGIFGKKSHALSKDVHSKKLRSSFILTHLEPNVAQAQEKYSTAGANELTNTVIEDSELQATLKKDEKEGGEVEISHLKVATQKEEWRQARSTIESSLNEAKETMDSKGNEIVDDVVAMDYAQPHRKPPIHNRKLLISFTQQSWVIRNL